MNGPMNEKENSAKAGFNRKYPAVWVLVLCLLLGVGVAVSMALLGGNIARFSKSDENVIELVPPGEEPLGSASSAEAPAEPGQEETPTETEPEEAPTETEPTPPAEPEQAAAPAESVRVLARSTAGNTSYTVTSSGHYRADLKVFDEVKTWSSETPVDLFKNSYDGTVEAADGKKVIAPGTSNFYGFTLQNSGRIPLDYTVSLKVDTYFGEGATYPELPTEWRLLSGDGTAVSDWTDYNERTAVLKQATLTAGKRDDFTIEWRWAFERGDGMDEVDTGIGNSAVEQPLGVNATIYVQAEQSESWDGGGNSGGGNGGNGGSWLIEIFEEAPNTGDTFNSLFYIVLMAISLCGLFGVFLIYRRRKKNGETEDGQK